MVRPARCSTLSTLLSSSDDSSPSSADESTTDQNELVYQLKWEQRDEIVSILNQYNRLLYGVERIENETKEKLMYDNADLYQAPISLPPKSDAASGVVLDLSSTTRSLIVRTLLANHALLVEGHSTSEESKMEMAERNNNLIVQLIRLTTSVITRPANESGSNGKLLWS